MEHDEQLNNDVVPQNVFQKHANKRPRKLNFQRVIYSCFDIMQSFVLLICDFIYVLELKPDVRVSTNRTNLAFIIRRNVLR